MSGKKEKVPAAAKQEASAASAPTKDSVTTPFERLQLARTQLNSALGSIEGADIAITSATEAVENLEAELKMAQHNVASAHAHSQGLRQSLHDACAQTEAAIRALRARYPVE